MKPFSHHRSLGRRALRGENLYMPTDGHLNAQGHEVTADILRDAIVKSGVLK